MGPVFEETMAFADRPATDPEAAGAHAAVRCFAALLLRPYPSGIRTRATVLLAEQRVAMWRAGDIDALWTTMQREEALAVMARRRRRGGPDAEAERQLHAAHAASLGLVKDQRFSQGFKRLKSYRMGPCDDMEGAKPVLASLHPPPAATGLQDQVPFVPRTSPTLKVVVTPEILAAVMRKVKKRRSSSSYDAWRYVHLAQLLGDADDRATKLMAKWVTRVANGDVPAAVANFLSSSTLVPYHKLTDEERAAAAAGAALQLRPIGMGCVLQRIISLCVGDIVAPALQRFLAPLGQRGFRDSGACEKITVALTVAQQVDDGVGIGLLDQRNAFNMLCR